MFAESGVDAVSTRQIGLAIGSANTNVVAYHFGSKEALIEAIYLHRLPALESRRAELLAELEVTKRGRDLNALMRALWLPLFEQRNSEGRHSYACFIAGHLRSGSSWVLHSLNAQYPVTIRIAETVRSLIPSEAQPLFFYRLSVVFSMVVNALRVIDEGAGGRNEKPERLFDHAIAMAAAAMAAPMDLTASRHQQQ